jgi:transposase
MPTVADVYDVVIGVDTHLRSHTLARAGTGRSGGSRTVANTPAGWGEALEFVTASAPGDASAPRVLVAMEGTRSHGAQLCRFLLAAGVEVIEVERPRRKDQRQRGKSDLIDARAAARAALDYDVDRLPTPREDGVREALRILLGARNRMTTERTATWNALLALLLTGHAEDLDWRARLKQAGPATLRALTLRAAPAEEALDARVRREHAASYARRVLELDQALRDNERDLRQLVGGCAPGLLDLPGVGPVSAAQAIVSWSHRGRCHNEGGFARLAGAAPLEASTGDGEGTHREHVRHRLNRGGDRQLNRALHTIATSRLRCDPRTRNYYAKRHAEGKSDREIKRCLKTYIARILYRTLNRCWIDPTTGPHPSPTRGAQARSSGSSA